MNATKLAGAQTKNRLLAPWNSIILAALVVLSGATSQAAITLVNGALPQATAGQAYNATLTATGGLSPYVFAINAASVPQGLSLSSTGNLTGTPAVAGNFTLPIQITDASSVSNVVSVSLRIASPSGLTLNTASIPAGSVGSAYDFTFSGQGGATPYSWDLVFGGGALPNGLTLSAAGRLTGTPTAAGVYPLVVRLTDANGNSFQTNYTLQINAANFSISTTSLAGALTNVPYSQQLTAVGGVPPYSFGLLQGTLPTGLTISSAGVISGLPTTAGTFNFFIRATDSSVNPAATQASFSIIVGGTGPRVVVSSLPTGIVNQAYSGSLIAQGGTAPYQFNLVTGPLPTGLTLAANGAIFGTPSNTGVFPVTVRATDAAGLSSQSDLLININSSAFSFSPTAAANGLVGVAYNFALSTTSGTAPIAYSLLSGSLPPGLTVGANGTLTGTPTATGSYNFVIRAQDATGAIAQAPLSISIQTSNLSIPQSALPNAQVNQPYSSTLTPVNGVAPFSFTLLSGSLPQGLVLASNGNISGIATTAGLYQITIKVTDANQGSAQATLNLYVSSTGLNITTIALPSGRAGQSYSTSLFASGGSLPYSFSLLSGGLPQGLTLSPAGVLAGTPAIAGATNFTVRVTDNSGTTSQAAYTLNINAAGSFTVSPDALASGQIAKPYSATLTASGGTAPYNYTLTSGSLPPGIALSSSGVLTGTPTASGSFGFTIQARDANNLTVAYSQTLTIGSTDLAITTTAIPAAQIGINYFATIIGGGGTAPYTFSLIGGTSLPPGLTLSSSGIISGTATATGVYPITVRITDQAGNTATANFSFSVGGSGVLQITTSALGTARTGQPYTGSILAIGGQQPYNFTLTGGSLPAGLMLSASGVISGTPTADGTSAFSVRVNDINGATSTVTLLLNVSSSTLALPADTLSNGRIGDAYNSTFTATGGSGNYSYSLIAGTLPAGLTLNSNGVLSGTPTAAGSFPLVVRVVDSAGSIFQKSYTLLVASTGLAFTNTAAPIAYIGQSYLFTLQAAGGVPPYVFSIANGTLPSGLTLNANGQITGLPETASSSTITFRVVDAAGASATVSLVLNVSQSTLTFGFTSIPNATAGQSYNFSPTATGGTGPYTYSVVGTLPAGLTLSPAGVISGTPSQPGLYNVTLRAQDSLGAIVQANYSLTIVSTSFRYTSTTLVAATLNQPYTQNLTTTGGTGTVTYALLSGSTLPAGITLAPNGTISGTPTAAGSSTFTIRATDSTGVIADGTFTLLVNAPVVNFTTSSLISGTVNQAYSQTLTVTGGTAPYTFTLNNSTLPPGLTLSSAGVLSGTPTATGTYSFSVRATDAQGSTNTANFILGIAAFGAPNLTAVVSSANYAGNGVSPGEILVVFGANLGPANLLSFTVVNGSVPTSLGGTRVLFDGVPAPVIYTSAGQVAAIAPFSIVSKSSVLITVEYQGSLSAILQVPVRSVKPALFTIDASGRGPAAALNQDNTVNSAANPARKETIVSLYLTGGGITNPIQQDGLIVNTTALLTNSVAVNINGQPATVQYAGNAPSLVPGVAQINVKLPVGTRSGANTIQVTIGTTSTTTETTIFVE